MAAANCSVGYKSVLQLSWSTSICSHSDTDKAAKTLQMKSPTG
jgi:ribonuclease I